MCYVDDGSAQSLMRVREIFELIRRDLEESGFYDLCLNFVLTGGGSQLQGIRELASENSWKSILYVISVQNAIIYSLRTLCRARKSVLRR